MIWSYGNISPGERMTFASTINWHTLGCPRNTSSSHSIIKLHSYIFRQTNQSYNFLILCLSLPRKCSRLFYILTCQPLSWTPWSNLLQLFNTPLPDLNPPNEPFFQFYTLSFSKSTMKSISLDVLRRVSKQWASFLLMYFVFSWLFLITLVYRKA